MCSCATAWGLLGETLRVAEYTLTRVDIDTGAKAYRVGRDCICSQDGHVVPLKADCLVQQEAGIDDSDPVRLSLHDCHVFMAAAGVTRCCPGLLSRLACTNIDN